MNKRLYVLDAEHNIVPQPDILKWGTWLEAAEKTGALIVGRDLVGETLVSTIFLGLDHNYALGSAPVLFETMVFYDDGTAITRRYWTWDAAALGHAAVLAIVTVDAKKGE